MVNTRSRRLSIREIYDSIHTQQCLPVGVGKTSVVFGEKIIYRGAVKWQIIRMYLQAMIDHGIIVYNINDAMAELILIANSFKLQCNVSMIEFSDGTIIFTTRIFTPERGKKEDRMFVALQSAKPLLLRGSFAIFMIKNGVSECIKVHPGMVKFENEAFCGKIGPIDGFIGSEKLDGLNMNFGCVQIHNGWIFDVGNKDTDPYLIFVPKENYLSEMNIAITQCNNTYAPHMVFKILTDAITKNPNMLSLLTQYTFVFELLNRRMFEICIGAEFDSLRNPELVLLMVYKSGVRVAAPDIIKPVFRIPKTFVIGSPECNKYMLSHHEGVVVLNTLGVPILKLKTPMFAFFQVAIKLISTNCYNYRSRFEFYSDIVDVVMKKCYYEGADPVQAKRFYVDNTNLLSRIVYIISHEFACDNFTIADITDPITGDCCNWGKIISSVIQSILYC